MHCSILLAAPSAPSIMGTHRQGDLCAIIMLTAISIVNDCSCFLIGTVYEKLISSYIVQILHASLCVNTLFEPSSSSVHLTVDKNCHVFKWMALLFSLHW